MNSLIRDRIMGTRNVRNVRLGNPEVGLIAGPGRELGVWRRAPSGARQSLSWAHVHRITAGLTQAGLTAWRKGEEA